MDFAIYRGYQNQSPTDAEEQLKFLGNLKLYMDF